MVCISTSISRGLISAVALPLTAISIGLCIFELTARKSIAFLKYVSAISSIETA